MLKVISHSIAAVFCLFAAMPSALSDEEAGTWRGIVEQPGVGTFEMVMVLDGLGGGTTDYPTENCGGVLSGRPGKYFETITRNRAVPGGTGGCIDGWIAVKVSGDTLQMNWSGDWEGEHYTASGTLTRVVEDPAMCLRCGEALAADLTAGLSSPATLRIQAQQSTATYQNCIRQEASQCAADCWRVTLADVVVNCESFDDSDYAACVRQAVKSASLVCR